MKVDAFLDQNVSYSFIQGTAPIYLPKDELEVPIRHLLYVQLF